MYTLGRVWGGAAYKQHCTILSPEAVHARRLMRLVLPASVAIVKKISYISTFPLRHELVATVALSQGKSQAFLELKIHKLKRQRTENDKNLNP